MLMKSNKIKNSSNFLGFLTFRILSFFLSFFGSFMKPFFFLPFTLLVISGATCVVCKIYEIIDVLDLIITLCFSCLFARHFSHGKLFSRFTFGGKILVFFCYLLACVYAFSFQCLLVLKFIHPKF